MKKILSLLGTAVLAITLGLPAAPASAQSAQFGFGAGPFGFSVGAGNPGPAFGFNDGYRGTNWCYWHPDDCAPRYRYRSHRTHARDLVDFDVDVDLPRYGSGHVARCEAHYRSYSRRTDMFLGFDGDHHRCRL